MTITRQDVKVEFAGATLAGPYSDGDQAERRSLEAEAVRLFDAWTTVHQGDAVVVFKGRKVAKGTRGVARWIGQGAYGTRVGLAVEGTEGLVYTAFANVKRDHSDDASAREIDAAHDSAVWYDANVVKAQATLKASGLTKGDSVTPKSGAYAGQKCRVIWAGTRQGQARVGVVPATKGRFDADWIPVTEATGGEALTFQGLRGRTV